MGHLFNKTIRFLLLFYIYHNIAYSQKPNIIWDKTYGGSANDECTSIICTSDGGFVLAGNSYSGISNDKTQANRGNQDYWILKIDKHGNKVWDSTFGGNNYDFATSIVNTKDNGYIIAGFSQSSISGDKTTLLRGNPDIWLIKIDSLGQKVWDKTLGGFLGGQIARSIISTKDNCFIVAGISLSNISGDKSENCFGGADYWILKIDETGQKIWDKTFGGDQDDDLYSITETFEGDIIMTGLSWSNSSGNKSENNHGSRNYADYFIVKINQNGNKIWDRTLGGNSYDYSYSISQTLDSCYIAVGNSISNISGDKSSNCIVDDDFWLIKIDKNGNKIWDKTVGGTDREIPKSIISTQDGGFIVSGYSSSNRSFNKTEMCIGEYDYWIVKFDKNANIEWDKTIGGGNVDLAASIIQVSHNEYVIGGTSSSNISSYKTSNSKGLKDFWIVKIKEPCKENIIHSGIITAGNYEASNSIKSNTTINNNINYKSGNFIIITPGFFVDSGINFSATIGNCINN